MVDLKFTFSFLRQWGL